MKYLVKYLPLLLFAAILVLPANAAESGIEEWGPQVVDYVYVNDTVNENIEYWIITNETMDDYRWTVNGTNVTGSMGDGTNNYTYNHTWNNASIGTVNTVIFTGRNNYNSEVEFRWYVDVLEIEEKESNNNIFGIMDDALADHVTDIKIRMFKYQIAKHGNRSEYVAQKVNQLHNEIAKRQMIREALRKQVKEGVITHEDYVAALKQAQRNSKNNMKILAAIFDIEEKTEAAEVAENGKNKGKHKSQKNKN